MLEKIDEACYYPRFNAANTIAVQLEALAHQHWCEPWEVIVPTMVQQMKQ